VKASFKTAFCKLTGLDRITDTYYRQGVPRQWSGTRDSFPKRDLLKTIVVS